MSHISKRDLDGDNSNDSKEERRKKRKSRWGGSETDKVVIPGLPTILPTNLTAEQERIYLLQLQIEEISRRLRTGELGIPEDPEARSPSPEPIYNTDGKRLNTREFRVRKKLEDERHQLVQNMTVLNPHYKAPLDYKPPQTKLSDKVLIPQEDYPDINFVGLLIGPRGNTLKSMEKETGAKIIIRGKGSIKEGKIGRKDGQPLPGEDEPLHAFLTAPTESAIEAATKQIMKIIKQAIELPENQNNLRRTQLRELALLNGTLRENDMLSKRFCSNCGSVEHRNWQCPEKTNLVNSILCTKCNGRGHLEKDCKYEKEQSENATETQVNQSKIDEEYLSLMAELGECSPPSKTSSTTYNNVSSTNADSVQLAITNEASDLETNQNNSHGLLPTPNNASEKSKLVTWVQKQGVWKQVIQDGVDNSTNSSDTNLASSNFSSSDTLSSTTNSSSKNTSNNNSSLSNNIGGDPYTANYYSKFIQQALAAGQDINTAAAMAATAVSATAVGGAYGYAGYPGYANVATTLVGSTTSNADLTTANSKSLYYNSIPSHLSMTNPVNSSLANNAANYIPSSNYGYGVTNSAALPTNGSSNLQTIPNNYSVYSPYYGLPSATNVVPPPPPPPLPTSIDSASQPPPPPPN